MQFELVLNNDRRALTSVRAFAREALRQLPLAPADAEHIALLSLAAIGDAIEHAYPAGEEGAIRVSIRESHGKLEILVRDYGVPQDVQTLERRLHGSDELGLFGCPTSTAVDELHWLAFGPEGKALQLLKWLHDKSVAEGNRAATLEPFREEPPRAPEQQYDIGRLTPDEAVDVSQLMYRAYGNTYFNPDVYYPERVAALNAKGSLISFVARDESGAVIGHCALELDQPGPVAELGQAVVDPAHRGRGLLDKLKDALMTEGERLNLVGWYADAVGVHTLTQKSEANHGGLLTGVDLGISPKTEQFRGISAEQPQRVTCLLYFHWLTPPEPRTIYVPARHQAIVGDIYKQLKCTVQFGESKPPAGHGAMAVQIDPGAARASIRVEVLGDDTVYQIVHARRELVERSGVAVVFVDLPLEDPGTPSVVEALEAKGFGLAGIAPHFSRRGDVLRIVYLVEPLEREPIKTFEPFADELVNYTLAEQARVRKEL